MLAAESADVVIELRTDGRTAAKAIDRALRDMPKGSLFRPTLVGRVDFPEVRFWRGHGSMVIGPLAEFKGSIGERYDWSVLVGRISSPAGTVLLSKTYAVLSVAVALGALAIGISTGEAKGIAGGLGVAALMISQLFLTRYSVQRSARAQSKILIREVRECVSTNVKTDS